MQFTTVVHSMSVKLDDCALSASTASGRTGVLNIMLDPAAVLKIHDCTQSPFTCDAVCAGQPATSHAMNELCAGHHAASHATHIKYRA